MAIRQLFLLTICLFVLNTNADTIQPLNFAQAAVLINSKLKYLNDTKANLQDYNLNHDFFPQLVNFFSNVDIFEFKFKFLNISKPCLESQLNFINALKNKELWSLQGMTYTNDSLLDQFLLNTFFVYFST
jgi:hypothetical protein